MRRAGEFLGPINEGELRWIFSVGDRELVVSCGSFVQLYTGEVYEVIYVEDDCVVTTQNKRFHYSTIDSVMSKEEIAAIEFGIPSLEDESRSFSDTVNHPSHYQLGDFETIKVIEAITSRYDDGFVSYAVGNSVKYISRAPQKHKDKGLTDLKKARKYLDYAIERIERSI